MCINRLLWLYLGKKIKIRFFIHYVVCSFVRNLRFFSTRRCVRGKILVSVIECVYSTGTTRRGNRLEYHVLQRDRFVGHGNIGKHRYVVRLGRGRGRGRG